MIFHFSYPIPLVLQTVILWGQEGEEFRSCGSVLLLSLFQVRVWAWDPFKSDREMRGESDPRCDGMRLLPAVRGSNRRLCYGKELCGSFFQPKSLIATEIKRTKISCE